MMRSWAHDRSPEVSGLSAEPLVGLRNIIWALAAAHHPNLSYMQNQFYEIARTSLQLDEVSTDDTTSTLEHCQAWLLVTVYEFRIVKIQRCWMSAGRAIRIAQALGLDRLDSEPQLNAIRDGRVETNGLSITDMEVRRRTFFMVFWADRCASVATGWSMALQESTVGFLSGLTIRAWSMVGSNLHS